MARQSPQKITEKVRLEFQDMPEHTKKVAINPPYHRRVTDLNRPFQRMRGLEKKVEKVREELNLSNV